MSIETTIEPTAIEAFVSLIADQSIFTRILAEIQRINAALPDGTAAEKRARFMADVKVIFDDLLIPVGENTLRILLELGVLYLKAMVV